MAVVIYHDIDGIFLGSAMGLGFWSKIDPVGQDAAVTFPNEADAKAYMEQWTEGQPEGVKLVDVVVDDRGYASMAACVLAGLPAWMDECTTVANSAPV